jgi:hypothetical protein
MRAELTHTLRRTVRVDNCSAVLMLLLLSPVIFGTALFSLNALCS